MLEDRTLPSTFLVTQLGDSGDGSLRSAVDSANAAGGSNTITFAVTGTIALTSGPLTITSSVTLQGPGAGSLSISGSGSSQILDIKSSDVTLSGLTITGGLAGSNPSFKVAFGANDFGGGIELQGGSLTANNCVFSGNLAGGEGGAIYAVNGAFVSLTGDTFQSNSSSEGGAIASFSTTLTVSDCTFVGNTAFGANGAAASNGEGGALYADGGLSPFFLTITDSTFTGNRAFGGNSGSAQAGGGRGGALYNFKSSVIISGSTFSGNQADGGLGNSSFTPQYSAGGAIDNNGPLSISNSTFNGNQVTGSGAYGGALINLGLGTASFTSSTVASNSVAANGKLGSEGGGLDNSFGGSLTLDNTIVALNTGAGPGFGNDVNGPVVSQGYNLIGDSSGSSGYTSTDLLGVNPQLGPLANNGGLTQTMALLAGSPGMLAGDPRLAGTPDQRGVIRGPVDIGAYNDDYRITSFALTPSASTLNAGQPVQLQGSFSDVTSGLSATVDIHWGDGTPDTILSLAAGVYSFSALHTYLDSPPGSGSSVSDAITATISVDGTTLATRATAVQIDNVPALLVAGGNAVLDLGTPFSRSGSFQDPGSSGWSVQVDYGDGSGAQPVPLNADQTFTLQHNYTSEGAYNVTLTLTDSSGQAVSTRFIVNVLLPGTTNAATAVVPPGSVVTASTNGVSITLFHAAGAPLPALVLVANISSTVAGSLSSQTVMSAGVQSETASYDVRAIDVVPADGAVVSFQYPANGIGLPVLAYFDRATGTYQPVQGSTRFPGSVVVDLVHHTITLLLDATSIPSVLNLAGTVFTISVPVAISAPEFVSLNFLERSSSQSQTGGEAFSTSASSALAQSNFLALASLSFLLTIEDGVGVAEEEANLVADLPLPGSSSILLPTVTLSPSQAGQLEMEEEGGGGIAPEQFVPPPPPPPAPPRPASTPPSGASSRNDTDLMNPDRFFARTVKRSADEMPDLPAECALVGDRMDVALLVSCGLFWSGFDIVPVGTDAERRRLRW